MSKQIEVMSEVINDLGNALTAAEWPVKTAKYGDKEKLYDTIYIYKNLVYAVFDMENKLSDLEDCVNELCLNCELHKRAHTGACNGCRWKIVKEGFR